MRAMRVRSRLLPGRRRPLIFLANFRDGEGTEDHEILFAIQRRDAGHGQKRPIKSQKRYTDGDESRRVLSAMTRSSYDSGRRCASVGCARAPLSTLPVCTSALSGRARVVPEFERDGGVKSFQ